ncbi:MAG: transcriptional regulator, MarR family [Phenylobacterium sp.]|nr:transcriptional regulator, MarR family [Phenylobacterium sp.]
MPPVEVHAHAQVFDEIAQIERLVRMSVGQQLPVGLTYPQYEVLKLLARRGDGLTPREIATALLMTKNGLTNTLQRLAVRKLITVGEDAADRRKKRVWLTADGRTAHGQAMAAIRPKVERLREGFTQKEFRDALPFLRALRGWLGEKD